MVQYQFIELVAMSCDRRIIESAFRDSEGEDFGAVAEGNSPYFLQGYVDVFRIVLYREIVCATKDYGPVIGL